MTVLLATHRRATEVDRLIDALRLAGQDFFRVNMGWAEASAVVVGGPAGPASVVIECDGRRLFADDISCGWYHQPSLIDASHVGPVKSGLSGITSSISNFWIEGLETLNCSWLNGPRAVHSAGNKLRQLVEALNAGLTIPPSTIGIGAPLIRSSRREPLVVKNLADVHQVWSENAAVGFLTRAVDLSTVTDDEMSTVPMVYQDRILPLREFRVVVVGDETFSVAIDLERRNTAVDVRTIPDAHNLYVKAELPSVVSKQLRRLLQRLDLSFCSADFIEAPNGEFYFIDLNACGSWWWVDDKFEGGITDTLVALLMSEASRRSPTN
jgi:hypothetical protein